MKSNDRLKVILVDCDGVLMNWEYAFYVWMERHGYKPVSGSLAYDVGERFDLEKEEKNRLVKMFNESAAIGFLPPLRDAMYYVDLLHRKHGYIFHMITSLSLDPSAQTLRIQNTKKLFGESAFEKFVFCDTGADKDEALEPYRDTGFIWVEDKVENAILGHDLGLESVIMKHGHNMNSDTGLPIVRDWSELYEYITN